MYSRYYPNRREEIHLPENYSGCAFPKASGDTEALPAPILRDPPPTKRPPEEPPCASPDPSVLLPPPVPISAPPPPDKEDARPPYASGLLSQLTHLFEFDQLLIMGLILLLLQSGEETETVLWLVLLLFC